MMPGSRVVMVLLAALFAISPADACSFFVIHDGARVFAGNNEDNQNPDTWVWYVPAEGTRHGCVYFGYGNRFPQGGMNDQGLFFDGAATKALPVKNGSGKKKLPWVKLFSTVMEECANVEEVIAFLSRHDLSDLAAGQMLYADATGDSVLVEGDEMIRGSGNYQITTNFYQSQVKNGRIPCERYKTIDRMLRVEDEASVDLVRKTLAAVHQEGRGSTQYSNIYDLVNLRIYLYHFYNFEEVVTIDLREELAKGKHESRIRDLFDESFAARTYRLQWESKRKEATKMNIMPILLITVMFIGPLALGISGVRRTRNAGEQESTNGESAPGAPWSLVINSAVVYALAYNLTFFLQELFLVIPKAIYGLQPILYHNNHRWLGSDPIENLLQGSGALAVLISGFVFCVVLSRQAKSPNLLKLFSIWMVYQGLTQSLHQVAASVLNPNGDVADALNYLSVGVTLRYVLAIVALGGLVFVGLSLTRPLLELAPSSLHVATPRTRTRFISQIGTLSAIIGVVLIIPFRIPPIEQIEGPVLGFFFPLFWTLANAWRVRDAQPAVKTANQKVNWILVVALVGLLAIFRFLLAPGVPFFWSH
jgi:penicillin V acylase-like amidase (Ntn superfamily)